MFEMLQKSNTHWCHYSQGERGPWWQHAWQLAELLTAIKLFGTEKPDVFIKLVHTKPLLQKSFENHFYFFFCQTMTLLNVATLKYRTRKECLFLNENIYEYEWENICVCMYIYTHGLHMQTNTLNYFHMELPAAAPKSWVSAQAWAVFLSQSSSEMPKKRLHPI